MPKAREKIPPEFLTEFTRRVVEARKFCRFSQAQMADALGIELDRYKTYEGRSLMPHHLIARFSEITGQSVHILMGGGLARRPGHIKNDLARELLDVFEQMTSDNQEYALGLVKLVRTAAFTSDTQRSGLTAALLPGPKKAKS